MQNFSLMIIYLEHVINLYVYNTQCISGLPQYLHRAFPYFNLKNNSSNMIYEIEKINLSIKLNTTSGRARNQGFYGGNFTLKVLFFHCSCIFNILIKILNCAWFQNVLMWMNYKLSCKI